MLGWGRVVVILWAHVRLTLRRLCGRSRCYSTGRGSTHSGASVVHVLVLCPAHLAASHLLLFVRRHLRSASSFWGVGFFLGASCVLFVVSPADLL